MVVVSRRWVNISTFVDGTDPKRIFYIRVWRLMLSWHHEKFHAHFLNRTQMSVLLDRL